MLNIRIIRHKGTREAEEVGAFMLLTPRDETGTLTSEARRCLESAIDFACDHPGEYTVIANVEG